MNVQQFLQAFTAALLCAGAVSCSALQKNSDPYAQDGGYNPYSGQPGQATTGNYQQYQPAQQQQPQQYAQQQTPQQPYPTYTPPQQDFQPPTEYTPSPTPKKKSSSSSSKKKSNSSGGGYTVRQGDTLYRIALNHGTTVSKIKSTNGLTSDMIHPGQNLTLP